LTLFKSLVSYPNEGVIKLETKGIFKKIFLIAMPIALQSLIVSATNLADVFMVGRLGEESLAGLGLANQIMFMFTLILFGINSGAGVLTAQFWGKKDIKSIHMVLGLALTISLSIALIFFLTARIIPYELIRIYSPDLNVIKLGGNYLKIVSFSYIFVSIYLTYVTQLRNMSLVKISVYSSLLTLFINVSLNYIFIFGKLGFREMGVEGAALATSIARFIEASFILGYIHIKKYPLVANIKTLFNFNKVFVGRYFNISLPVMMNELFWALGITSYSMIYARMSTSAIATINVVTSIERIVFTGFIGIAHATSAIVGNKVGEGNEVEAKLYGRYCSKLAIIAGLIGSVIIFISAKSVLYFYGLNEQVYTYAYKTLMSLCIILPFKAFNATTVVGILRGGGDTKYALLVDLIALWTIGVPFTFFSGLYFSLPIYFVYLIAGSEEIIKFFLGLNRIKSDKWIKNVTENI